MAKKATLGSIAARINAHLKRMEADKAINKNTQADGRGLSDFYCAGSSAAGRFVYVTYITYQGHSPLTRQQAEAYLAWLDAGNNGKHYEVLGSFK
jgi:hypothetical protein